jgi:hypothetical protein
MRILRLFAAATIAAAWLAVAGAASPVSAALINGQFSINGLDRYDFAANTIGFVPGSSTVTTASGDFAASLGFVGSAITFAQGNIPTDVDYTTLTGLLFTGVNGLSFTISGLATFEEDLIENELAIRANGTLTLAGSDPTPGRFSLTTQLGGDGLIVVSFSATTVAVPGPALGAGVPGLLLACGGLVGFVRRRRREQIA